MAKKHPDKYGDGNPPPLPGKTLAQYLDERVRRSEKKWGRENGGCTMEKKT